MNKQRIKLSEFNNNELKAFFRKVIHEHKEKQTFNFTAQGQICSSPETWAIDTTNAKSDLLETFLYQSESEYKNDLTLLA
jgi:hypothetical protein